MNTITALVAGHITHDRHARGFSPGGCAHYAGAVYRQLGVDVHLAVTVGDDFAFADLLDGVACTVTRSGNTTVFANIYPPADQPRIQLIEEAAPAVPPSGLPEVFLRADIVHLAPVISEIDIGAWSAATDARILAINVQGWVRRRGDPVRTDELAATVGPEVASWARGYRVASAPWAIQPDELRGVDVAFLSEEDLSGQGDLLDRLCQAVPIVAVTHGADGCDIIERDALGGGRRRTRIGVYPAREVDATGAGDTFAAGFLYQLASGSEPIEAARFGAAAASIIIESPGTDALAQIAEASDRALRVPVLERRPV